MTTIDRQKMEADLARFLRESGLRLNSGSFFGAAIPNPNTTEHRGTTDLVGALYMAARNEEGLDWRECKAQSWDELREVVQLRHGLSEAQRRLVEHGFMQCKCTVCDGTEARTLGLDLRQKFFRG